MDEGSGTRAIIEWVRKEIDEGVGGGPHEHPISDVEGLQAALDGKAAVDHVHEGGPGGAAWGDITGTLSEQTDLQGALDGKEDAGTAASAVSAHEAEGDPHTVYLLPADADALYEPAGAVLTHEGAADPHPTYLRQSEADALYEAAGAVAAHAGEADPHPGYLTPAEGDAAYEAAGAVATHAAAADPHTGYQKESEKAQANGYASLGADGKVPSAQLPAAGSGNPLDAWPVGSVFIAVVATSPATLLGGGTWAAFGAGRVLVGLDAAQTEFDTVEETGGVKTVTLTAAQSGLPQHTHIQDAHSHVENSNNTTTGGLRGWGAADTSTNTSTATGYSTADTTAVNQDAGPADAAQAHTNLQPYIVVYMWKRTA